MRRKAPNVRHARHYLKEWREKLDITQEEAMDLLGWSQPKISRIENMQVPLSLDDLQLASKHYKRTAWELMHLNPAHEADSELLQNIEGATPEQRKELADFANFIRQRDQTKH